jgi:hypothetical protein
MIETWDAFGPPLTKMERNLVFELRETGNRWAHYKPLTDDDVDRALDSVERLLVAVGAPEADMVRQTKADLRRSRYVQDSQHGDSGAHPGTHSSPSQRQVPDASGPDEAAASRAGSSSLRGFAAPFRRGGGMAEAPENWRLILAGAQALTAAGQTPFTRIGVYEWIWERYPRDEHDRPSLDPTFQGMVRNATGGPRSAGGTPLLRVDRGLYVLAEGQR